jgi:hypothetical protein
MLREYRPLRFPRPPVTHGTMNEDKGLTLTLSHAMQFNAIGQLPSFWRQRFKTHIKPLI